LRKTYGNSQHILIYYLNYNKTMAGIIPCLNNLKSKDNLKIKDYFNME